MKVVILAGGFGTRISEESHLKPKPMIEVGEKPILWHIMKYYSCFGHNEFIICCGYKQHVIKEYFSEYYLHMSDVTFDFGSRNEMTVHNNNIEPWKVTLVDTGLNTMTGGRVKRIKEYIGNDSFLLTYGDGVSNVDVNALIRFHIEHGKLATLTAIRPGSRFGIVEIDKQNTITTFKEKSREDGGWINGGFMALSPRIIDYIEGDATVLEHGPLETLANLGELKAFRHEGFWQCMDNLRDKTQLEKLWESGEAPWKIWK
jgi:glucose-1-phosphate cytidylyltransferase